MKKKQGLSMIGTVVFTILGLVYIAPILIVLMNSFKKKVYINKEPFTLPTEKTWNSIENYLTAIDKYELLSAVGWTVFITVGSVLVILVCTSMCAWYITRVKTKFTKALYMLCVPEIFQSLCLQTLLYLLVQNTFRGRLVCLAEHIFQGNPHPLCHKLVLNKIAARWPAEDVV